MRKQERSRASFFNSQTFLSWRGKKKRGYSCSRSSRWFPKMHRGREEKTVRSLGGVNLNARRTSPDRLLRPSVLSGCFLSSLRLHLRAVCKLRMNHRGALLCALRPATHTVPVILCSQAGPAGDAQPSSLKKKRKKKKKKIQSWPKLK